MMRFIFLIILLLFVSACSQTTSTSGPSFIDHSYPPPTLASILVDARTPNFHEKAALESSAAATLQHAGVQGIAAMDTVPPAPDDTIYRRHVLNTGVQAVLEVVPLQKQIVESYTPGSYRSAGVGFGGIYYDPLLYDPPLILREPEIRYGAALYALPHYDRVWSAELTTRGPQGMGFKEVSVNFGREVVQRLAYDGVISPLH